MSRLQGTLPGTLLGTLCLLASLASSAAQDTAADQTATSIQIADVLRWAERHGFDDIVIADNAWSKTLGLSGKPPLEPNEGMLFVYKTPGRYGIWMKEMRFSIDIAWFGADGEVVHIERQADPATYDRRNPARSTTFHPPKDALYVLEVSGGALDAVPVGANILDAPAETGH